MNWTTQKLPKKGKRLNFRDTIKDNEKKINSSFIIENTKGEVSFQLFFNKVFNALEFGDLIPATIKTYFFGFAIGLVGCFKGYYCEKGTVGVGLAANSAVVFSSMLLFIIDFIAVFVTDIFFEI